MGILQFEMADRENATGVVGLVQAFVNTVDLQDGPEELSDPNTLKAWLVAHDLMEPGATASEADLKHAIALREAIRGLIGVNSGGKVYPLDVATLNEAATASRLRTRFGADGRSRLEPEADGVAGAMGRIVAAVFAAMADGITAAATSWEQTRRPTRKPAARRGESWPAEQTSAASLCKRFGRHR